VKPEAEATAADLVAAEEAGAAAAGSAGAAAAAAAGAVDWVVVSLKSHTVETP
jgi:hypothetical protein